MKLSHYKLTILLQKAYSAEKAAAFAYQGHAGSVKDKVQKAAIRQIELDEWNHRHEVLRIMQLYDIPVSRWFEFRFHKTGRVISWIRLKIISCCPFLKKSSPWAAKKASMM